MSLNLYEKYNKFLSLLDSYLSNPIGIKDIFKSKRSISYTSSYLEHEFNNLYIELIYGNNSTTVNLKKSCVNFKISEIYSFFKKNLVVNKKTKNEVVNLNNYDISNSVLKDILVESKHLFEKFDISLIPICSVADGGFVSEWSDVDCMLYLGNSCFESNNLREIQKETIMLKASFSYVDPMQNHGFFTITDLNKRFHCENRMPISVIKLGYSYPRKLKLYFNKNIRNSHYDKKNLIKFLSNEIYVIKNLSYNYSNFRYLLHRVFLFPSLYFQYIGEIFYKPTAIKNYKKRYNDKIDYLKLACDFYDNFNLKRKYRNYISVKMIRKFSFILPFLLEKYYSKKNSNLFTTTQFNIIRFGFIKNIQNTLLKKTG